MVDAPRGSPVRNERGAQTGRLSADSTHARLGGPQTDAAERLEESCPASLPIDDVSIPAGVHV
jgi:hypothetical protein